MFSDNDATIESTSVYSLLLEDRIQQTDAAAERVTNVHGDMLALYGYELSSFCLAC